MVLISHQCRRDFVIPLTAQKQRKHVVNPSPLSLRALWAAVSPTSSLPMAWGNSWLSEYSSPPLWAHIDWLPAPPKAKQHGAPAVSFLLVLLNIKSEGKNSNLAYFWHHYDLLMCISSILVCFLCCNEYQMCWAPLPHVSQSEAVESSNCRDLYFCPIIGPLFTSINCMPVFFLNQTPPHPQELVLFFAQRWWRTEFTWQLCWNEFPNSSLAKETNVPTHFLELVIQR